MKSLKRQKGFGLLMAMIVLPALVLTSAGARPPSKAPLRVRHLTVEHMTNPLGIDTSIPRFGWIVEANYNGAEQTAYEIRVSSKNSRCGHVWSSGQVKSGASFDVAYDGKPLQPNTRYYWSVRVWDHGRSSPWSKRGVVRDRLPRRQPVRWRVDRQRYRSGGTGDLAA